MERLWEEAVFTYVALAANPLTEHLAEPWLNHIAAIEACWKGQRDCWRAEYLAAAILAFLNYDLDSNTEEFSADKITDLRKKNKGWKDRDARKSPEYKLYLRNYRLFELVRLAVESQIVEMADWPLKQAQEENPELQAYAPRFDDIFTRAKEALKKRTEAEAATGLHRVKEINALVETLNKARRALHATLSQIALDNGESKTWPDVFFRATEPPSPDKSEARGKALAILGVLKSRQLEVSDELAKKILVTTDSATLDRWIALVAVVPSAENLLTPPPE